MTRPYSAKATQGRDEQWLLDEKYGGTPCTEFDADKDWLAQGEPVAYVIGHQPFLGLRIYLDSHPLIPRAETEWWVEQLLQQVSEVATSARRESRSARREPTEVFSVVRLGLAARSATENTSVGERSFQFLDLCAGSGAIGCAVLAKIPSAQVFFGEVDPAHKATILKNIRENNLDETRADIRIGDLFEPFGNMQFDLIAINPPYIPATRVLPNAVTHYEPSEALYSGEDGLDLTRRIATSLAHHLTQGGQAWVEVDAPAAAAAADLFTEQGFTAEIRTDQFGLPRVVVVSYP